MKTFRIFEDSAPFLLVIHQSFQENTSNLHQPFHGSHDFPMDMGLGGIEHLGPIIKEAG